MKTNWTQIREVIAIIIDFCEMIELQYGVENFRAKKFKHKDNSIITGYEILQAAISYSDSLSATIIRARHELKDSKRYSSELEKILVNTVSMLNELLLISDTNTKAKGINPYNTESAKRIDELIQDFKSWFTDYIPELLDSKI